jgi:hypothetical protein
LHFLHGRSFNVEFDEDAFTSTSVRYWIPLPDANDTGDALDDRSKRRKVEAESRSPRAATAARLWLAYDRKYATQDLSRPRAWLERLAMRVIATDDQHPLRIEFGAAERELFASQYIQDAEGKFDALAKQWLVRLGHLLRLQPSSSSSASASQDERQEQQQQEGDTKKEEATASEEEFAVDVARLLVMVAKVAMHDAEQTFPEAGAYNQQLVHDLDLLADVSDATAADDQQPPPPPTYQDQAEAEAAPPPCRTTQQATEFVRDYVLMPWPT